MKILYISEALSAPFDEGIKNVALSVHKNLEKKTDTITITKTASDIGSFRILKMDLNKLFMNNRLRKCINDYYPDVILYLPEASVTFNSYIRAKVLKYMHSKSKVVMIGVKRAEYSTAQKYIISTMLRPDLLLLLGNFNMDLHNTAGVKYKVLPPAVDNVRFCKTTEEEKQKIRRKFNMPGDKTLVLHVGHIRTTRNVASLVEVQKLDNLQVVIVGSTSTVVEKNIKDKLQAAGIRVIDYFIPDISSVYKMSDIYIFPVFNDIACIEMPLSVLEAMACNLSVITTRFGGLVDHFKEDEGFRYFDTHKELVELVQLFSRSNRGSVNNNNKVASFTWDRFADEVLAACSNFN